MNPPLKIGTRESQLAVWQATQVLKLLEERGISSELIFIKSEGDTDTVTPLYELGVQGIFTRALDSALLNNKIDIAVHSMKDVPTQPAAGIRQAAVLKRASFKDILVFKGELSEINSELRFVNGQWAVVNEQNIYDSPLTSHRSPLTANLSPLTIATSSLRRKAQWLHRYPNHTIESLRGNVNTRLRKLNEHNWHGVIFASAGLERIGLRPENSIDLDWMLPAPAQGAITISCRTNDDRSFESCQLFNDEATDRCTKEERNFLRALLGGCSTPISALAIIESDKMIFKGNICSTDGREKFDIEKTVPLKDSAGIGLQAAGELLENEKVKQILFNIRNA
jgi:hydroxymethylbilane synthase